MACAIPARASIVFFDTMYELIELSRRACAFMMRSMFADQPCSDVTRTCATATLGAGSKENLSN